ncbi:1-phosphofructokinase [Lachnoclostridium sp. An169]|uniref:1-phosphofructokinase n=1 Tax=Lachnoclostridium sp. An169 TaxID=1965569 RepID=UPI000B3785DA|nr:1-phosphofructokinase [Lachnoclostridium sp. An169]OUP82962.1 1-phosphofructokinase [Lachnoclostridium sp. An169]HJA65557.1 1-phosphofructokinase [Candidatus Mediterraneibacter cottocaccae]
MIYTVTFNPSLDYIVETEGFQLGSTNRTVSELMLPGGKGINVSTVLKNLGIDSTALGFTAGFTGDEIIRRVRELGFQSEFIDVGKGFSRINIKMKEFDGTEINGRGPDISTEALNRLLERLDQLRSGDTLVLAGSIPASIPDSIYSNIMARLDGKGIVFVVDATGDLLLNVLKYHPFLIKPNHHELGELFGVTLQERDDVAPYAAKLQEMGARNVLVSMGGKGAVLLDENQQVHSLPVPEGKLVNAVGSGDSMVAGFLAGWAEKNDYGHAFKMGISAGSASAFSELLATKDEILKLYQTL